MLKLKVFLRGRYLEEIDMSKEEELRQRSSIHLSQKHHKHHKHHMAMHGTILFRKMIMIWPERPVFRPKRPSWDELV